MRKKLSMCAVVESSHAPVRGSVKIGLKRVFVSPPRLGVHVQVVLPRDKRPSYHVSLHQPVPARAGACAGRRGGRGGQERHHICTGIAFLCFWFGVCRGGGGYIFCAHVSFK